MFCLVYHRLNESLCVDATRAGNMAHLLNHSCEPNCVSRTVSVRDGTTGTLQDHVIIFAKAHIQVGRMVHAIVPTCMDARCVKA